MLMQKYPSKAKTFAPKAKTLKRRGKETIQCWNFLDAIESTSTYACQLSVGQWFIVSGILLSHLDLCWPDAIDIGHVDILSALDFSKLISLLCPDKIYEMFTLHIPIPECFHMRWYEKCDIKNISDFPNRTSWNCLIESYYRAGGHAPPSGTVNWR